MVMKNCLFLPAIGAASLFTVSAVETAPSIPSGPVSYTSVSVGTDYSPEAPAPGYSSPVTQSPDTYRSSSWATLRVNLYSTNYEVRGMGVTNPLSNYGWSSFDLTLRPGGDNLFGMGLGQEVNVGLGVIYGAGDALGDAPVFNLGYGLTKELLPNLKLRAGYELLYGGLEGYLARERDKAPHRITEDINVSLNYNDNQQGFFGGALVGLGFQGLTGLFGDLHVGYRWQDPIPSQGDLGLDVAFSVGQSYSLGYWVGGAEGFDATRLRLEFLPYSLNGSMGRDAKFQIVPWVQTSWSGNNAKKIDRADWGEAVDHFQFSIGVDLIYNF